MILNFRIKIRTGNDMICANSFEVSISGGLFKFGKVFVQLFLTPLLERVGVRKA